MTIGNTSEKIEIDIVNLASEIPNENTKAFISSQSSEMKILIKDKKKLKKCSG